MSGGDLKDYLEEALDGLKDFQSASVKMLYRRLYQEDRRCMLLADEVGLGKTVVAKGLIAQVLLQRIEAGLKKPFKVTYICSNQVIAKENLKKLNPFPEHMATHSPISRIAYLAWHPGNSEDESRIQDLLELNTLTPATSFQIRGGLGTKWEREIIFRALCHDESLHGRRNGLAWILKGTVRNMERFKDRLRGSLDFSLRGGLARRFLRRLKGFKVPRDIDVIHREFQGRRRPSLYDAIMAFAGRVDGRTWCRYRGASNYLAAQLRECLIECCLKYVDADLYILDEFQRFRDLIETDSDEDQARLARKVFFEQKEQTRVLLLSATPFKAFTGHTDMEQGEDHYEDFRRVLRFLMRDDDERLNLYESHRQAIYRQILDLKSGEIDALSSEHRNALEEILRSVMCRTERHCVAADPNAMVADTWKSPMEAIPFSVGDVENFRSTDRLAQALTLTGYSAGKPIEYCKSALFPLSFLDRYKLKEELRTRRNHPAVAKALKQSQLGWLDLDGINKYEWIPTDQSAVSDGKKKSSGNARLQKLIDQAVGRHGSKLLWVPPSLPYYELEDAFTGTSGFSKTLLFSSWVMVPRMVSTLVSYEVERQTVGNRETVEEQEADPREYFSKRRTPAPLLRFSRRKQGNGFILANMSNFTLLFPSQVLADVASPIGNLKRGDSLGELRKQAEEKLQRLLTEANLDQYSTQGGESERWYWAAPLLLDRESESSRRNVKQWFEAKLDGSSETDESEEEFRGARREHLERLEEYFEDPSAIGLGAPPSDLAEVLADLALGSPAVIAFRSLRRLFAEPETVTQLSHATSIADEFISLFNKPESIAAIRLSERHEWYWRMVADYCASGCLQAVLDEYFHLLRGQNVDPEDAITQLLGAVNLNASTIHVDSLKTFLTGDSKKMRCHYAVEFGSQRIETDEGQKRASGLREVFNSPFRPFLLSTTSIGQEGLDFHSYCRRIVHWNLPSNPVDLEQREGRINRFKSLVIRQQIARKYGALLSGSSFDRSDDIWRILFDIADKEERQKTGKCELAPFWHVEPEGNLRIERIIPLYPFSVDRSRLRHILKTLAIYRLAFGQPRQAELIDHLLERNLTEAEIQMVMKALMINLSPIGRA